MSLSLSKYSNYEVPQYQEDIQDFWNQRHIILKLCYERPARL